MTRYLIVVSAFLAGASALACPNLSGTFSDPANDLTLTIKQAQADCSQITIDQGTGPVTYAVDGNPHLVPGTDEHMILAWDGDSLLIGSTEMATMRQVWSLTSGGDLSDVEQLYDGSQWQPSSTDVIARVASN